MLEFEKIESKMVFKGNRVKVYEDILKTPDGKIVHYDRVKNRDGAGILLVDSTGMLVLVNQYRRVIDRVNLEIAAGSLETPDEDPAECAVREAIEETGYKPNELRFVNNIVGSIGLFEERTAVYIGTFLEKEDRRLDDEEFIDVVKISLNDALEKIYNNEIVDSKTIVAILAYKDLHDRGVVRYIMS